MKWLKYPPVGRSCRLNLGIDQLAGHETYAVWLTAMLPANGMHADLLSEIIQGG